MHTVVPRLSALALILVFSPLLFAADPWDGAPMSAEPRAILAAAEAIPAGEADLVILLDETRHVFDERGRGTTTQRMLYRVVADSAVDNWSSITAPWAPWYQEKPTIQARVITKDGTVHALDEKALVEQPAREESLDIFSDNRIFRAPLPAIAPGSVVEQLITWKSKESFYDGAASDVSFFGSFKPVHRTRLVIDAPASLPLHLVNQTAPRIEPRREEKDGRVIITVEGGPFAPPDHFEWDLPFDVAPLPWFGVSTGSSWGDLAKKYSDVIDRQLANHGLEAATREAIGNTKDKKEIIARSLAWIQKRIRYAGVEVGESSVIPRTPQTVLGNRYGDCKDKATLLVAMLRQAGLSAHVALLRAGEDFDVPRELPGLGMFNHAIVVVDPSGPGDTAIWVDPTDEYSRAGELPTMDQGRLALIASGKTTALTETPVAPSTSNRVVETRIFKLPEEGKATVTEITEAFGADESAMRRYYVATDRKQYRESIEGYVKSYYNAKALKDLSAGDARDLTKPFRITLEVSEAGRGVAMDGEAAVAIFPGSLLESLPWSLRAQPERPDDDEATKAKRKRRQDFVFSRPFVKEWQYRIAPPSGFVVRTLPQNETKKLGTLTLAQEYSVQADGSVLATFRFDSGKRRLSASEVEEVRKAIKELDEKQAVMIGFDQRGQLELAKGNISAALTEFRKLAALHPKEGRHQVEIAKALLAGGMGDAAREQIRKAIALEPNYPRAWRMQGIILQHDLFARPYRKGFDLAGAIAAYRKAKELDPKDEDIRAEYAKLLELGEEGLLFGRNAKIEEAVAEFRALITDFDDTRYQPELYLALSRLERFDELKKEVETAEIPLQRSLWRVVSIAATENSAAAIREAASTDQSQRRELLRNAAGVLASLRRYPVAADLMEEATKGAPSTETRSHIESLRKATRYDEVPLPENDPKSVVKKLAIQAFLADFDVEDVARYYASDEGPLFDSEAHRTEWRMARMAMVAMAREQGLPLEFYADLGMGNVQIQHDGDDAIGHRLRMRTTGGGSVTNDTVFVIKEGNEYRVSASRKSPGLIGFSVLRLLRDGKRDAARQWLNWTREEFAQTGGDDALATTPFSRYWPKSKATATDDEMRIAAAMLMPSKELGDRAIEILTAAREKASGDDERTKIDHALAITYAVKDEPEKLLPVAERLHAAMPDSETAFNYVTTALTGLHRHADSRKLAEKRMEQYPRDRSAMRVVAGAEMYLGNYAACDKQYRQIVTELEPTAGDYNNIAWNALLSGSNLERALEDAREAMKLPGGNAALLHTLASLYAETGKSLEAREALLQSMDSAGREDPAPHDWYVLGRIAENYGVTDAAMAAYQKVEKPKNLAASTYLLAERRMKAIGR
ncbi:MAG TPA: DUF3857 domain-containing protein [Thermoanaerobaculia bacterium]|jgi:tetratricopeptide (TPR) repeat protein